MKRSRKSDKSQPEQSGKETPEAGASTSLLTGLGVFGYDPVEPVILASLISAEPLLLIGEHGTGKSYLLNRIASALHLESRHYNASLLNYDDLVGYPLPGPDQKLRFIQTPASVWGAQAIFLDEISRCRPDLQNKLFPIIHEKKVQGMPLEDLVYRWSAINPPVNPDHDEDWDYQGSQPLDAALADRFAFIVQTPGWADLPESQQELLLRHADGAVSEDAACLLNLAVDSGRELYQVLLPVLKDELTGYVRLLLAMLSEAGIHCSPRRGAILLRNISAVHCARLCVLQEPRLSESAYLAVAHSLPQPAAGKPVDRVKVLAAHREAWRIEGFVKDDPRRHLYLERDPLKRAIRASRLSRLSTADFSTIVADALGSLPAGASHALASFLFESGAAGRLVAAIADQCGTLYGLVSTPQELSESVRADSVRHQVWQRICQRLSLLPEGPVETYLTQNLLIGLFSSDELPALADVDKTLEDWVQARRLTQGSIAA